MPGKHHLRGFKIAKKIGSPLRGSWTMVSTALVDARITSLTGVQNSKKIGSPLRGSWTMVSIALVDARKTSLMGVQNSKKIGSPLRGSWTMLRIVFGSNPPLGKKIDPPLGGGVIVILLTLSVFLFSVLLSLLYIRSGWPVEIHWLLYRVFRNIHQTPMTISFLFFRVSVIIQKLPLL